RKNLHLLLFQLGNDTVLCRIPKNQTLLHRAVERAVKHTMRSADGTAAQSWGSLFLYGPFPAVLLQVLVEFLDIPAGELIQLDAADARDRVLLDASSV